ncbi:IclR family transcriptional regulator [Marinobacter sp.]|uniref:IclR family transcriptional regulator n=1 Tax=Marinobacter sp. TaxID=50741 RepID=UPI003B515B4B
MQFSEEPDEGQSKDRKFVEALARGLNILRAFGDGPVMMGNQDLSRLTGLPKPTVSRMTYTLTQLGYLNQNPDTEKYQLGSEVLSLGYTYVANLRVRQLSKPYMDEFAREYGMSIGLTCRDRMHMIYVENRMPPVNSLLRVDLGLRLPMATTSAGRAFIAGHSAHGREHLLAELEDYHGADKWKDKQPGLVDALGMYDEQGYCLSLGEWDRNIVSAGVPIRLPDGTLMALTCAAPAYDIRAECLKHTIAPRLAGLASDIQALCA